MSETSTGKENQHHSHHHHHHHHHPHHPPSSNSEKQKEPNHDNDEERVKYIIDTFINNFGDSMRENPKGWRGRFRKMAADDFAFYRGSAVLFYRDLKSTVSQDPWLKKRPEAVNTFIHVRKKILLFFKKSSFYQGDLHAENFGTYIDRFGLINFDVNDFR